MKSVAPGPLKLAAVIFFTAASFCLSAAEPQLPPSKRNAPKGQQIEFSPATAPQLPKPTPRSEELQNRTGIAPNVRSGSATAPASEGFAMQSAQPQISKALAERMLQELDRKKNWLVPGAQDASLAGMMSDWMRQGFEKKETDREEKNESVMERFLNGSDAKNKSQSNRKTKDSEFDRDGQSIDNATDEKNLDGKSDAGDSKGFDFSLRNALGSGPRTDAFGRGSLDLSRTTRPDFGQDPNRTLRDRELAREREDKRVSEFQQMIRPRSGGITFNGVPDPINSAPDLTRRDLNPVLPRATEPSRPEISSFTSPAAGGGFRGQDGMFGVAAPSAPSFAAPSVQQNFTPAPTFRPASSIILEPPKRKF